MTWFHWQIPPFVTSVFFVLGVLTFYWVTYNWLLSWAHTRHVRMTDEALKTWYGFSYMLVFVFGIQSLVVGQSTAWQFMNFQLIAVIFCAYFLNIHVPYYDFIPIMLIYMAFDHSLGYWQSWGHAITLVGFFWALSVIRQRYRHQRVAPVMYLLVAVPFGGLLWWWMKLKFDFSWLTFWQEWVYLVLFECLLYVYVTMLADDSELKLRLAQFASHDALTQAANFSAYTDTMAHLFQRSRERQTPLTMMMFDIDHFKQINDTYGHSVGDVVLQEVTAAVQTVLTENDGALEVYRTGGEEFNVLFPGYTLTTAEPIVTQIFSTVNHLRIQTEKTVVQVSLSVGVSEQSPDDKTPIDFYNRVDQNLYHSKRHGRMRITMAN